MPGFWDDFGKAMNRTATPFGGGSYDVNQNAADMNNAGWQSRMQMGSQSAQSRGGPMIDAGPQSQFRGYQTQLAQQLMDQAMGKGPSLAQAQLQQATDRNMQQAMALGASQQGMGAGGAMRQIGNQRAQIGQQMAGDSAILRMQEQMQAQGMLGQLAQGARGQDLSLAQSQAQMQQNQTALNDQMVQFYLSQGMGMEKAQAQARLQQEAINSNAFNQGQSNKLGFWKAVAGGAGQAAGGLAGIPT